MGKLNGRKVLVRGNHDKRAKQLMNVGFDFVCEEMIYFIANERVTVSHFPFKPTLWRQIKWHCYIKWLAKARGHKTYRLNYMERRPENKGQFLIHGHTHSDKVVDGRMIHVGVDAHNYEPVSLNKIANIISDIKRKEKK